ncbi:hypothetical protein pb186bvf_015905 [Paramecium bursaria]
MQYHSEMNFYLIKQYLYIIIQNKQKERKMHRDIKEKEYNIDLLQAQGYINELQCFNNLNFIENISDRDRYNRLKQILLLKQQEQHVQMYLISDSSTDSDDIPIWRDQQSQASIEVHLQSLLTEEQNLQTQEKTETYRNTEQ